MPSIIDFELLEETIKTVNTESFSSDFVLKVIGQCKNIIAEYENRDFNYRNLVSKQGETFLSLANINNTDPSIKITKKYAQAIKVLNDDTEYTIKEVAEILNISKKNCTKIFERYKVLATKRAKCGNIYFGSEIKQKLT